MYRNSSDNKYLQKIRNTNVKIDLETYLRSVILKKCNNSENFIVKGEERTRTPCIKRYQS